MRIGEDSGEVEGGRRWVERRKEGKRVEGVEGHRRRKDRWVDNRTGELMNNNG